MGSPDGIDTFLAWSGREKQQKAKGWGYTSGQGWHVCF